MRNRQILFKGFFFDGFNDDNNELRNINPADNKVFAQTNNNIKPNKKNISE